MKNTPRKFLIKFRPTNWKNDPSKKNKNQEDLLDEIVKNLKVRYKRTVERKWREGEFLTYDKEKGIINEDTGEIVVGLKAIEGLIDEEGDDEAEDDQEEKEEKDDLKEELDDEESENDS